MGTMASSSAAPWIFLEMQSWPSTARTFDLAMVSTRSLQAAGSLPIARRDGRRRSGETARFARRRCGRSNHPVGCAPSFDSLRSPLVQGGFGGTTQWKETTAASACCLPPPADRRRHHPPVASTLSRQCGSSLCHHHARPSSSMVSQRERVMSVTEMAPPHYGEERRPRRRVGCHSATAVGCWRWPPPRWPRNRPSMRSSRRSIANRHGTVVASTATHGSRAREHHSRIAVVGPPIADAGAPSPRGVAVDPPLVGALAAAQCEGTTGHLRVTESLFCRRRAAAGGVVLPEEPPPPASVKRRRRGDREGILGGK